ncbi:MAG: histidinol-phosphate transaminase [Gammaproteobacteria bacterium]|nr:MAG: histidinol-phosphate transaminase [Gammaproteobacteria bacterium]
MSAPNDEPLDQRIARLIAPQVRALSAYAVANAAGLIKLDAMENPYPWPAELKDEWLERLRGVDVNRYPDPRAAELKERLRGIMAVPASADILLGNGSDELIQLLILAIGGPGSVVFALDPSFAMYALVARATGRRFVSVPLDEANFGLRLGETLEAIRQRKPALTFIAYPNNPTGNLFDSGHVEAILDASPGLVVVDEAYAPFAQASFLAQLVGRPNLVVLRTVSKLGLAGLRLGMLAGAPEWARELEKLRLPYNINALTQASAELALSHYPLFQEQTRRIVADRDDLYARLAAVDGIQVWPSKANFLLIRTPPGTGSATVAALRERGVLVKDLHGASPLLRDCVRVTVGRPEENAAFFEALVEIIAAGASE